MTRIDKIMEKENLNAEHIFKCLKYYPFKQHYDTSPILLQIRLNDNIARMSGKELSVPDRIDKEVVERFSIDELKTFRQFIMHENLRGEISQLFNLLVVREED